MYYIDVKSVEKIDRYTVEFRYSRPYFRALEICGSSRSCRSIYSMTAPISIPIKITVSVGTGPYKLSNGIPARKLCWCATKIPGAPLEINRIVYKFVAEINVALQMLKKGDVMTVRPIQWVRQTNSAKFSHNFYKLQYYIPNYNYIGWNARRPLFGDRRVRRALTMLINREAILDKLLFGLGQIVSGTSYINSKYYDKRIVPWPYDPAQARRLLAEAGWADHDGDGILDKDGRKFSFVFTISSGSKFAERLGTILKEDFAREGIEMSINRYEWAVFVQKLNQRDFDAVTLAWSLSWEEDPYQLWHSSQIVGGSNFCGFSNREADDIIVRARAEFDENRRVRLFHRFHRILHEEQPYTFLFCSPSQVVVSKRFNNVKVHTRGLNTREWKVDNSNE